MTHDFRPQTAAATLIPLLPDLHPTALSRLYTLRTFRDKLGARCLAGVTLSESDCEVLATYLARKGVCAFDGEVGPGPQDFSLTRPRYRAND